tara:strand:+ start:2351 stop:2470 length:120 start_codon:yes stop_codon:yes gene_type:complete
MKKHPLGGETGLSISPERIILLDLCKGSGIGTAERSAPV